MSLRLVIFGFSKRLNKELFPDYRGDYFTDDFFLLLALAATPVFFNYAMMAFGTFHTYKSLQQRDRKEEDNNVPDPLEQIKITEKILYASASADAVLHDNELQVIKSFISLMNGGLPIKEEAVRAGYNGFIEQEKDIETEIWEAKKHITYDIAKRAVKYAALVMLCDGEFSHEEAHMLSRISMSLNIDESTVSEILAEVGSKLSPAR